jgi:hypothetical protein
MSRATYGKRERDRAKKAKADAKRQRRQSGTADDVNDAGEDAANDAAAPQAEVSNEELLRRIEEVHRAHADGRMSDDDFETTKAALLARLAID